MSTGRDQPATPAGPSGRPGRGVERLRRRRRRPLPSALRAGPGAAARWSGGLPRPALRARHAGPPVGAGSCSIASWRSTSRHAAARAISSSPISRTAGATRTAIARPGCRSAGSSRPASRSPATGSSSPTAGRSSSTSDAGSRSPTGSSAGGSCRSRRSGTASTRRSTGAARIRARSPGRYAPAGHGGALTILPGSWGASQTGVADAVPSPDDDVDVLAPRDRAPAGRRARSGCTSRRSATAGPGRRSSSPG